MTQTTSEHGWTIPTPGGDEDQWGTILNDFFDSELDRQVTLEDAYANRPAADDTSVKLFLATDRRIVYYNDGTSWEAVYGLGTDANPVPGTSHFEAVETEDSITESYPVVDARAFGAVADGATDVSSEVQSAIDSLTDTRGIVRLPRGRVVAEGNIDLKRAFIIGHGIPSNGVEHDGTVIEFPQDHGFYSSINDDHGMGVYDMMVQGSTAEASNGQTLIDYQGQNHPKATNVRVIDSDIGIKLRASDDGNTECHYGGFVNVSIDRCSRGLDAQGGGANEHDFYAGRFWNNATAVYLDDINSIAFHGTSLEANDTALDTNCTDLALLGARLENGGGENLNLRGGSVYSDGTRWSSGDIQKSVYGRIFGPDSVADGIRHRLGQVLGVRLTQSDFDADLTDTDQLRVTLSRNDRAADMLEVRAHLTATSSTASGNHGFAVKRFGHLLLGDSLSDEQTDLLMAQTFVDGDITLENASGSTYDLVIKNATGATSNNWSVTLNLTSSRPDTGAQPLVSNAQIEPQ